MFGWLRRFDDWLERRTREESSYRPVEFAVTVETEDISGYDWAARKAVVERLVAKTISDEFAAFEADHRRRVENFACEVIRDHDMLVISFNGERYAINTAYLLTVNMEPGNPPLAAGPDRCVIYSKSDHQVSPYWHDDIDDRDHRYFTMPWPEPSTDDAISFVHVNGSRFMTLRTVHGKGEEAYGQIMDALARRKGEDE